MFKVVHLVFIFLSCACLPSPASNNLGNLGNLDNLGNLGNIMETQEKLKISSSRGKSVDTEETTKTKYNMDTSIKIAENTKNIHNLDTSMETEGNMMTNPLVLPSTPIPKISPNSQASPNHSSIKHFDVLMIAPAGMGMGMGMPILTVDQIKSNPELAMILMFFLFLSPIFLFILLNLLCRLSALPKNLFKCACRFRGGWKSPYEEIWELFILPSLR